VELHFSIMHSGRVLRDHSGFSLIEIAVALAILGLVMTTSLPFLLGWKETTDLRSAATRISDIMHSARMRAVVDRSSYTVTVDYATDEVAASPPVAITKKTASVDLFLDNTDPDCPPLSSRNVVFRANGTADAAGFEAVYLKSRSARVAVRYRVKVMGATGKVGTEKWTGGEWVGAF